MKRLRLLDPIPPSPELRGKNQVSGEAADSHICVSLLFPSLKSSCSLTYNFLFSHLNKRTTAHCTSLHIEPWLGSIKLLAAW